MGKVFYSKLIGPSALADWGSNPTRDEFRLAIWGSSRPLAEGRGLSVKVCK